MTSGLLMPEYYPTGNKTLKKLVADAGLSSNLELCLDAGDSNSYPGTGNTWYDVSGNDRHFWLGRDGIDTSRMPTFVGSSGDPESYFVSDGGDGFQKSSANDTFINNMHKTGFEWTVISIDMYDSNGYGIGFNTKSGNIDVNNAGIVTYRASLSNGPVYSFRIGSAIFDDDFVFATDLQNSINMVAWGAKYNAVNSRDCFQYINGGFEFEHQTSNYSPQTSNASGIATIGMTTNNQYFMTTNRRIYGFMIFNKFLSESELNSLRSQISKRWYLPTPPIPVNKIESLSSTAIDLTQTNVIRKPTYSAEDKWFDFDGSDDYMDASSQFLLSGNNPYTILSVIRWDVNTISKYYFCQGHNSRHQRLALGTHWQIAGMPVLDPYNNAMGGGSFNVDEDYIMGYRYSSGDQNLYQDGTLIAHNTYASLNLASTNSRIGRTNSDAECFNAR